MALQKTELEKLAGSVVSFRTWKNKKDQSVCAILFGKEIVHKTFTLDGQEELVLDEMKRGFWSVRDCFLN